MGQRAPLSLTVSTICNSTSVGLRENSRANEMALWVKARVAKPDTLKCDPETHLVEGES